jgi:hypothetical protein
VKHDDTISSRCRRRNDPGAEMNSIAGDDLDRLHSRQCADILIVMSRNTKRSLTDNDSASKQEHGEERYQHSQDDNGSAHQLGTDFMLL